MPLESKWSAYDCVYARSIDPSGHSPGRRSDGPGVCGLPSGPGDCAIDRRVEY